MTHPSIYKRYLVEATEKYAQGAISIDQLPENRSIECLASGIASAWKLYGNPQYVSMTQRRRWVDGISLIHICIRVGLMS